MHKVHPQREHVVVSQNEFCDSALTYFNVFFNFGVGSFSSISGFGRFFMGENGFSKFLFCTKSQNFKVVQKKTLKYIKAESQNSFWLTTTRSNGQGGQGL